MKVAFIVSLNLDDLSNLPDQAREIEEHLTHAGYEVLSVAPWQRPSLVESEAFQPEQPQQQPTIETNIL